MTQPDGADDGAPEPRRHSRFVAVSALVLPVLLWALGVLVWVVQLAPDDLLVRASPRPGAWLLRLPVEPVALLVLLVLVPSRWRRPTGLVAGTLLGAATVVKLLDLGFTTTLGRPFDLATDWTYLHSARDLARDALGGVGATALATAVVVLAVILLVGVPLAGRHLAGRLDAQLARHRAGWTRAAVVTAVVWSVLAVAGVPAPGAGPAPSGRSSGSLAEAPVVGAVADHVAQARAVARDRAVFAHAVATDPWQVEPPAELLPGLRGKDVLLVFVESYGEVAVSDSPQMAAVGAALDRTGRELVTDGYTIRSGWLDSPTFGGTSWLAHSTLQSGVWVDSQRRYDQLLTTDRLTLSGAFRRAGWRTVADVPSNRADWPEGQRFYGYDQVYDARDVGYAGPRFGYATMPDQYTLKVFADRELTARPRAPVMAEIDLVTSHVPWAPLPRLVPWQSIGDGSVYGPIRDAAATRAEVWRDPASVQRAYAQSIAYSLDSLAALVQHAHDDNLVVVLLGDHQPSAVVSGAQATHRVPITLLAHDPAVTDQVAGWRWAPGMRPGAATPTWRMDQFRDRVLEAFGPRPGPSPVAAAAR